MDRHDSVSPHNLVHKSIATPTPSDIFFTPAQTPLTAVHPVGALSTTNTTEMNDSEPTENVAPKKKKKKNKKKKSKTDASIPLTPSSGPGSVQPMFKSRDDLVTYIKREGSATVACELPTVHSMFEAHECALGNIIGEASNASSANAHHNQPGQMEEGAAFRSQMQQIRDAEQALQDTPPVDRPEVRGDLLDEQSS